MNAGQKAIVIVVLAGGILLASRFISRDGSLPNASAPTSDSAPIQTASPTAIPSVGPSEASSAPAEPAKTAASAQMFKVNSFTPDAEVIRKEVAEDPHTTPKSMLQFAVKMGQRMENVGTDPVKGKVLFGELDECVKNSGPSASAVMRASCLANARVLGDRIPSLQSDYKALLKAAPPSVIKLAQ